MSSIRIISVLLIILFGIGLISAPLSFYIKTPTDDSELFTDNDFLLGMYAKSTLNLDDIFPDIQNILNHPDELHDWFFEHEFVLKIQQGFNTIMYICRSSFDLVFFRD